MHSLAFGRRAAQAVALIVAFFAPSAALAQSGSPLGPGPFSSIRLKAKGLLFTINGSASDATLFAASPELSLVVDGTETNFDAQAKVKKAGAKLLQGGTVGGRAIADAMPDGAQSTLKIRNPNGAATEVALTRHGSSFTLDAVNRQPGGGTTNPGPAVVLTGSAQFGGHASSSADLVLTPEAGPSGLDVTIDAALPAPPAGATATVSLVAKGPGGGESNTATVPVAGSAATLRLRLPAATYGLTALYTVVAGTLETSQLTVTRRVPVAQTIAVAAGSDHFSVELPTIALPALATSTVAVSGGNQFDAPTGGHAAALVALASASQDGSLAYAIAAARDLDGSGSASVQISAPAGTYTGAVSITPSTVAAGGQIAANYHVASLVVQSAPLPGTIDGAFPTMLRVPASIEDPSHVLPAADLAHPGAVAHVLTLASVIGLGTKVVSSSAIVLDASEDFALYFPVGGVGTAVPVLDLSGALPDGHGLENVTLTYNPNLVFVSAPSRIDLVVPNVQSSVTLAGRTVDAQSTPLAGARATAFTAAVDGLVGGTVTALYVTESDGRFRFDVPPAATYTVSAVYTPAANP